jgi:hypothetical protein
MEAGGAYNPRTVEEVFRDFKGRRAGMIKALTTGNNLFFLSSYYYLSFVTGKKLNFEITLLCVQMFRSFSDFVIPVSVVVPLRFDLN